MSIIYTIIVAWLSQCLVTRLVNAHIALCDNRGRLIGIFQDRADILVYGKLYCIKCLFVNFRHLRLD